MKRIFFFSIFLCAAVFQFSLNAQTTYTLVATNVSWDDINTWSPKGIPGPGDYVIVGGTTVEYTVEISGAHEIAGFYLDHGGITLTGTSSATLTVTDTSTWISGSFKGSGNNSIIFAEGSVVNIVEDQAHPYHHLYETTFLTNRGTINLKGSANFGIRGNSILKNEGIFDVMSDADFTGESFSGGTFINTGTFRKSGGTDITSFNLWWVFQNDGGTIDVQSGTLQFSCDGTFTDGNYNAALGAKLEFISGTQVFKGTLSGAPAGIIMLNGSYISSDSADVTLDFKGKGFQFSDGYLIGGGAFIIPGGDLFVLPGTEIVPILGDATTLLNQGTIRMEGENDFIINGNAIVDNQSLFDVTSDADFTGSSVSGGTFLNSGTLRKSGGNGITQCNLWWDFHNKAGGTIDVQSGEIEFTSSSKFENAQGGIIQGIASIKVPTSFTNDGIISPGNSPGILTYIDNFLPSSTAILDIQLGGLTPGSEYDQLDVTGSAKLNGTLKISLIDGFIPAKGDSFVVLTTTAAITDSFATIDTQSGLYLTVKKNSNNITIFVDSVGTITSVENKEKAEIVTSYNLSQNYPNPFNPSTTISWQSPVGSWQTLKVYDILGKAVAVLVDEFRQAGRNEVKFDASQLASGVYIYRITAGKFSSVKKMLLQK